MARKDGKEIVWEREEVRCEGHDTGEGRGRMREGKGGRYQELDKRM